MVNGTGGKKQRAYNKHSSTAHKWNPNKDENLYLQSLKHLNVTKKSESHILSSAAWETVAA